MKRSGGGRPSTPFAAASGEWARRFLVGVLVWLVPVAVAWVLLTPFYNRFLTAAAERLVGFTESPAVTSLVASDEHFVLLTRSDTAAARGFLYRIRVTDLHFNLLMLGAFFLAVPGVAWRKRLENLGWAALVSVAFHILLLFLYVKFAYATQLGSWSLEHYPQAWRREFWGMAKHVFDLPLKFALPLILWAAFYFRALFDSKGETPAKSHKI